MTYSLKPVNNISAIGQTTWDACANPCLNEKQSLIPYDPFLSYNFLYALEKSGSAAVSTGWAPYHLQLEHIKHGICGVVPMYLKNHSQGEYVFDHNWAEAFQRAGGRYYPKLQISVPFTPVTGRRILIPHFDTPELDQKEIETHLISGMMQVAEKLAVSSVHITFAEKSQYQRMGEHGFLQRTHNQFH